MPAVDTPFNEGLLPEDDIYLEVRIIVTKRGEFLYKGPLNEIEFDGLCMGAMKRNRERIVSERDRHRKLATVERAAKESILWTPGKNGAAADTN